MATTYCASREEWLISVSEDQTFFWYMLMLEKKLPDQEKNMGKFWEMSCMKNESALVICQSVQLFLTAHVLNWIIEA